MKLSAHPATPPSLLHLPFEIRLQIYHYCIPRKHLIDVRHPRRNSLGPCKEVNLDLEGSLVFTDNTPNFKGDYWNCSNKNGIFLLSKQINEETLDILYRDNTFQLCLDEDGETYLKNNFAEANRRRMRYLLLTARPVGISYKLGRMPDNALWSSIIPSLKTLRIVVGQPEASSLKQEMELWVKWIGPFLQYFGQHLSGKNIQVDINSRIETRELVRGCLPHGYRDIQCRHLGDFIFGRKDGR